MSSYHVVEINEAECIGCTKCIEVCPVDAILGAAKQIHRVLTEYCIGCNLCLAPCPTHCITTVSTEMSQGHRKNQAKVAKKRVQARKKRITQHLEQKAQADNQAVQNIQAAIAAAIARSQQKAKSFTWAENE